MNKNKRSNSEIPLTIKIILVDVVYVKVYGVMALIRAAKSGDKKRRSKPRLSIITMTNLKGTIARRQFMRGTDPIKSTWEYPKSIR